MIFRWSLWGEKFTKYEMLRYSISSFHACFGNSARYIVYTDEPHAIATTLDNKAETYGFDKHPDSLYNFESRATWRKWAPTVRLSDSETEIYVDTDVFIVGEPHELRRFCTGIPGNRFLALQESKGDRWCFGQLKSRVPADSPFINAGLIGQQPLADLTENLAQEFNWWRTNVNACDSTFHDEQGAVVAALAPYIASGHVDLLPSQRYRIVSPRSNADLKNLEDTALIHTTHPDHPAFDRFRKEITAYIDANSETK